MATTSMQAYANEADDALRALRAEAAEAGDLGQVDLADWALDGRLSTVEAAIKYEAGRAWADTPEEQDAASAIEDAIADALTALARRNWIAAREAARVAARVARDWGDVGRLAEAAERIEAIRLAAPTREAALAACEAAIEAARAMED